LKFVAFLRKNFVNPAAHARTDVHLVYFNRPGNGVLSISARGEKNRQSEREKRVTRTADMMSCEQLHR
jgi:hypothetical protein